MTNSQRNSAIIVVACILLVGVVIIGVRGGVSRTRLAMETRSAVSPADPKGRRYNELVSKPVSNPALAPLEPSSGRRDKTVLSERDVPATLRLEFTEDVPPTLTEICVWGEITLECEFIENPWLIGGNLSDVWAVGMIVLKENRILYDAIREVEGDDGEVGPAGERGPYRITPAYWKDGCEEISGQYNTTLAAVERLFDYEDCVDLLVASEIIMKFYWQRYGAETDEQRARLHNSGPDMQGTDEYWAEVKAIMEAN